ncbi:MAG: crossover junction endodeoxyribonuclease RuvC [Patescibacteria group bacterium]|nr:crossover junction endodeoxyribonuclease RuvC [Patescibacteria group bacterium]MCL5224115.1 crossover junction endodeoxyribonuclease RuvC [Patescibacteria group bacterium]
MKILGIDPGTARLGYGLIETKPSLQYIDCGVFEPRTPDSGQRLKLVSDKLVELINKHKPRLAVVEGLYFSTNKKTALSVAEARGVIILTLTQKKVPLMEFTPNQVKSLVTGWGRSDKKNVELAVGMTIRLPQNLKVHDDAMDALALALCGSFSMRTVGKR